jgi:peptide/nickel transport system substrate-binding protein
MEVDFQNTKDVAGVVNQFTVQKDFDVVVTSLGLSDDFDSIYIQMTNYFRGPQSSGRYGFANAKMDSAIDALGVASTDDQKRSALKSIAEVLATEVPAVPIAVTPNSWIYSSKLQGVQTTSVSVVMLDKAWLER